jgi:small-conductance mechanosensitive channel
VTNEAKRLRLQLEQSEQRNSQLHSQLLQLTMTSSSSSSKHHHNKSPTHSSSSSAQPEQHAIYNAANFKLLNQRVQQLTRENETMASQLQTAIEVCTLVYSKNVLYGDICRHSD